MQRATIRSLKASGLFSFGPTTPLHIQFSAETKWINFGIGPNNAGKSNVLRVLEVFFAWYAALREGQPYVLPREYLFGPGGDSARLEITIALAYIERTEERKVLLKFSPDSTEAQLSLLVDGQERETLRYSGAEVEEREDSIYAGDRWYRYARKRLDCIEALRSKTVLLRADDGLFHITDYLIQQQPETVEERLELVRRLSDLRGNVLVDELALSPSLTLVSVIHTLTRSPERLAPINELASRLGVRFRVEGGQLLHSKLDPRGEAPSPLRPLALASDGTLHALMLFYVLTSDADNYFIDEPGSKLHPSFHAKLRTQLAALAARGCSVFVITHAPSLISPEHDRLLHFSPSPAGTHLVPLHQSRAIYEHAKSVHGRNLFFAEFVVLIEGPLDYGFFTALQRIADPTSSLGAVLNAVHFSVCHGTKNFTHALRLFRHLPTPWIILADADYLDGVCRKNSRQEAAQKTSAKFALVHMLVEAKDHVKLFKELPLYSDWESVQPLVRSSELPNLQKGVMGQKLISALKPLLGSNSQFVDECQAELRRFAQENLRSYVWQPTGNGALEAALSIDKDRARNPDYDEDWERIATKVLEEWQAREEQPQDPTKATPAPEQIEGSAEVVDPTPDQSAADAEAEEEAGEAKYKYADVLDFLSYLERMYYASVGKPHIWLPEVPKQSHHREKQQQGNQEMSESEPSP